MSGGQRIGLLVATLVVLVVAFFALSPGDDSEDPATTTPTVTAPELTATAEATTTTPAPRPQPKYTVIRVRDGRPVGGVKTIKVTSGERARIEVRSQGTTDEVHVHGYDISRQLKSGGRVRFVFKADAEGIFEIELEGSHTQIAKLEVEPG